MNYLTNQINIFRLVMLAKKPVSWSRAVNIPTLVLVLVYDLYRTRVAVVKIDTFIECVGLSNVVFT